MLLAALFDAEKYQDLIFVKVVQHQNQSFRSRSWS